MTVHRVHVAVIRCEDGELYADADYLGDDDPSTVHVFDGDKVVAEQTFLLREPDPRSHEVLLVRLPLGDIISQLGTEPLCGEVLGRATITEGQGV